VVERAFVTYSNEAKREMIGVPWDAILGHGAVSEPVARAMAAGALARSTRRSPCRSRVSRARRRLAEKPVGLVHFAAQRAGFDAIVERHVFPGDRDQIRR
jgi:nicotinamide-nucleotide amidase